jgi:hypothetical protein
MTELHAVFPFLCIELKNKNRDAQGSSPDCVAASAPTRRPHRGKLGLAKLKIRIINKNSEESSQPVV